jgi:hypothetical protein
VDQIVVSVGPYMFQTAPARARSWAARSGGTGSPPISTWRSVRASDQPAAINMRKVEGVAWRAVIPALSRRSRSWAPSTAAAAEASSSEAPRVSGSHSSRPAMSKDRLVTASRRSARVSPGWRAMASRKLITARWGMATAFGRPVEPEVWIT